MEKMSKRHTQLEQKEKQWKSSSGYKTKNTNNFLLIEMPVLHDFLYHNIE